MFRHVRYSSVLKYVSCSLAVSFCIGTSAGAQVAVSDLDVIAADGAKLRATYVSPGKPGPGVLLLHQCNMDRKSWAKFATELARTGIHSLAVDYRGFGESPRGGSPESRSSDLDAALASLISRKGVNNHSIALVGASCGVDNAVRLAERAGTIKVLMLLSGPVSAAGLKYLHDHPRISIFGAASSSEEFAVSALRAAAGSSSNRNTLVEVVTADGHGAPLFDADPILLSKAIEWLTRALQSS
jgi:pimeloyl-ACP methyl ester carboxylesterase